MLVRARLYKIIRLILEKYPTLSRVWVGKYGPRVVKSTHAFCISPGRGVGAFLHVSQNRAEGQFSAPEPVTKWGKVLILRNPFCQGTPAWRRGINSRAHLRQPFYLQTRFPTLGFLLRANVGETAGKRSALAGKLLCGNALCLPRSPHKCR